MKGLLRRNLRLTGRLLWLAGEILVALMDFVINVIFAPKVPLARARALWLQQLSRRVLRILKVEIKTQGPIPLKGLLVSNHLSYLDILVLSAVTPAVFIAKSDVKRWPIFGWFTVLAGTLFVRRAKRSDVARLNREVTQTLDAGALVVLFPEGRSPDGREAVPFKSSLLEPVTRLNHPLSAACIEYSLPEGDQGERFGFIRQAGARRPRSEKARPEPPLAGDAHEGNLRRGRRRMKVLVTAGPAYEPIDAVRRLTNFSTGELGVLLANQLARSGFEVFCLRGAAATYAGALENCRHQPFSTNEDLLGQLVALSRAHEIDAVFHTAALCDFKVTRVEDAQGKSCDATSKIDSRSGALTIHLEAAPKVIGELRKLFPRATLVGWKYELNGGRMDALGRAWRQVEMNRTDACVLNGQAWGTGFALCVPPDQIQELRDKAELAAFLPGWLMRRPKA